MSEEISQCRILIITVHLRYGHPQFPGDVFDLKLGGSGAAVTQMIQGERRIS
jgi:hypothetical protein